MSRERSGPHGPLVPVLISILSIILLSLLGFINKIINEYFYDVFSPVLFEEKVGMYVCPYVPL